MILHTWRRLGKAISDQLKKWGLGERDVLTGPHAVEILGIPGIDVVHLGRVDGEQRARQLRRHGDVGLRGVGKGSMLSEVEEFCWGCVFVWSL